jgi:hypothetical protein
MSLSHMLRTREFTGDFEAERLIVWLMCNEYPGKRITKRSDPKGIKFNRVHRILKLVQDALALGGSHQSTEISKKGLRVRILQEIDEHLRRYKFRLRIGDSLEPCWTEPKARRVNPSEEQAVVYILKLSELGLIDRIRPCDWCTTWFFARFSHQKYCKTECQLRAYAKKPEWQEHRRRYMRKYRREHPVG